MTFDSALTITVPATGIVEGAFQIVRHSAKEEAPLRSLRFSNDIISTIAEVTFYGRDQAGNEVSATGIIGVDFRRLRRSTTKGRSWRRSRSSQSFVAVRPIVAVASAASACAVDNQEAPALAGPSGFAQSLIVTAAPQVLSRDGSSMSTISVIARNADGSPMAGRRLLFSAPAGTLVTSEVLTANDGRASVVYIAPSQNEPVTAVEISVTPIEAGDRANTSWQLGRARTAGAERPGCELHVRANRRVGAGSDLVRRQHLEAGQRSLPRRLQLLVGLRRWVVGPASCVARVLVGRCVQRDADGHVTDGRHDGQRDQTVRVAVPPAPTAVLSMNPLSPAAGQAMCFHLHPCSHWASQSRGTSGRSTARRSIPATRRRTRTPAGLRRRHRIR